MGWGSLEGEDLGSWLQDQQHFQCLGVWVGSGEQDELRHARRELWVASQGAVRCQWLDPGSGCRELMSGSGQRGNKRLSLGIAEGPPCPMCSMGIAERPLRPTCSTGIAEGPPRPTCSTGIAEGPPRPMCSTQWRAWSLMNVGGMWQKLDSRVTGGVCVWEEGGSPGMRTSGAPW